METTRSPAKRLRRAAQAGLAAFVVLVALEHPLRPDLPADRHFVSEYAHGSTAPVQVAAFLAWAAATAACVGLAAGLGRRPFARGAVLAGLTAATAALLVASACSTQTVAGKLPPGTQRTLAGRLHDLATLVILVGLLLAALASARLVPQTSYRLVVVALGVVLLAIVPALVAAGLDAPGIGQRGFILVGIVWEWSFATAAVREAR